MNTLQNLCKTMICNELSLKDIKQLIIPPLIKKELVEFHITNCYYVKKYYFMNRNNDEGCMICYRIFTTLYERSAGVRMYETKSLGFRSEPPEEEEDLCLYCDWPMIKISVTCRCLTS